MKRQTDKRITFYLSEEEFKTLNRIAKDKKQSVANYIRYAINLRENSVIMEIRQNGARLGGLAKAAKYKPSKSPWENPSYFNRVKH